MWRASSLLLRRVPAVPARCFHYSSTTSSSTAAAVSAFSKLGGNSSSPSSPSLIKCRLGSSSSSRAFHSVTRLQPLPSLCSPYSAITGGTPAVIQLGARVQNAAVGSPVFGVQGLQKRTISTKRRKRWYFKRMHWLRKIKNSRYKTLLPVYSFI